MRVARGCMLPASLLARCRRRLCAGGAGAAEPAHRPTATQVRATLARLAGHKARGADACQRRRRRPLRRSPSRTPLRSRRSARSARAQASDRRRRPGADDRLPDPRGRPGRSVAGRRPRCPGPRRRLRPGLRLRPRAGARAAAASQPAPLGSSAAVAGNEPLLVASGGDDARVSASRAWSRAGLLRATGSTTSRARSSPRRRAPTTAAPALFNARRRAARHRLAGGRQRPDGSGPAMPRQHVPCRSTCSSRSSPSCRRAAARAAAVAPGSASTASRTAGGCRDRPRLTRDSPAEAAGRAARRRRSSRIDGVRVAGLASIYQTLWRGDRPERDVRPRDPARRRQPVRLTVHALDRMKTLRRPRRRLTRSRSATPAAGAVDRHAAASGFVAFDSSADAWRRTASATVVRRRLRRDVRRDRDAGHRPERIVGRAAARAAGRRAPRRGDAPERTAAIRSASTMWRAARDVDDVGAARHRRERARVEDAFGLAPSGGSAQTTMSLAASSCLERLGRAPVPAAHDEGRSVRARRAIAAAHRAGAERTDRMARDQQRPSASVARALLRFVEPRATRAWRSAIATTNWAIPAPARDRRCARYANVRRELWTRAAFDARPRPSRPSAARGSRAGKPGGICQPRRRRRSASVERRSADGGTRAARARRARARIASMNTVAGIGWVAQQDLHQRSVVAAATSPPGSPAARRRRVGWRSTTAQLRASARVLTSRRDSPRKLSCTGVSSAPPRARASARRARQAASDRRRGRSSRPSSARCRRSTLNALRPAARTARRRRRAPGRRRGCGWCRRRRRRAAPACRAPAARADAPPARSAA